MRRQVDAAMAKTFRPEFLNRIDDIVVFHPLGMEQIQKIVDIQLKDVRARLAKERMEDGITPAAKQMLAVGGLDPVFGARPLKRLVQREVVDAIAAAIIDGRAHEGDKISLDVDSDGKFEVAGVRSLRLLPQATRFSMPRLRHRRGSRRGRSTARPLVRFGLASRQLEAEPFACGAC